MPTQRPQSKGCSAQKVSDTDLLFIRFCKAEIPKLQSCGPKIAKAGKIIKVLHHFRLRSLSRAGMTAIDFAAFVDELADVSGETILPFFRTVLSVQNKSGLGSFDPVTAADRAAEAVMRALIRRHFPAYGIIG